jgi:hypothetical protein
MTPCLRLKILPCVLLVLLAFSSTGCATMFRGRSEQVTVRTDPSGRTIYYQGRSVGHGESLHVRKEFETPQFQLHGSGGAVPLEYNPDPWLIGDAAFLLLGIIPGVIALGIDIGTGAWRNLADEQVVILPESKPAAVSKIDAAPEDEIFSQPIQP